MINTLKTVILILEIMKFFRIIFANSENIVTIECFSKVLNWFGPLKTEQDNIIPRIILLCSFEWFVGDVTRIEAEKTLKTISLDTEKEKGEPLLPYIVRLSLPEDKDTSIHPASITYYSSNNDQYTIDHLKIEKKWKYVCHQQI